MNEFQTQAFTTGAMGQPGTISRVNPAVLIPLIVEGKGVLAGTFGKRGTNKEKQVTKLAATDEETDGLIVFQGLQPALAGIANSMILNEGQEVGLLEKGFAYIVSTTATSFGDAVFYNPATGNIATGTGAAGFDTGWVVETGGAAGQVSEIKKI